MIKKLLKVLTIKEVSVFRCQQRPKPLSGTISKSKESRCSTCTERHEGRFLFTEESRPHFCNGFLPKRPNGTLKDENMSGKRMEGVDANIKL